MPAALSGWFLCPSIRHLCIFFSFPPFIILLLPHKHKHTHTHAREISIVAYYFRQSAAAESRYLLQWPSRFFCLLRCFVFFEHLVQALICFSAVCFPPLFPPLLLCILIILPQTPTPWQQRFCFFFLLLRLPSSRMLTFLLLAHFSGKLNGNGCH